MLDIIWSYSKGEFTVDDHYYFSKLKRLLDENFKYEVITNFDDIISTPTRGIVFNYPEEKFSDDEIDRILDKVAKGTNIILLGYYLNEDQVASNINSILDRIGGYMNYDAVRDSESNHESDELLPIVSGVSDLIPNVERVLMPCSASLLVPPKGTPLLWTSDGQVLAASTPYGKGTVFYIGTCVFWDNFAIRLYDNMQFSLNLLKLVSGRD